MAKQSAPMTLGGVRGHGIRGLFMTCQHRGHERALNMEDWPDATVPSLGPGKLGVTAIPNWIERAGTLPGGARR
jgi:hypothetical protein